jgi:hypothetical protein
MTEQAQLENEEKAFKEIEELVSKGNYRSFTLRVEILKPDRFVTACRVPHPFATKRFFFGARGWDRFNVC